MKKDRVCPACGGGEAIAHCDLDGTRVIRCVRCRSLYVAVLPDSAALAALYSAPAYHRERGHLDDGAIEGAKAATTLSYLRPLAAAVSADCRYLEIGCSGGASLAAAASLGWRCWGVEMSPSAAQVAAARRGVEAVYSGSVEAAPLPPASFDVIALFDVVEHFEDPRSSLSHIRELLKPGGFLLLLTPDGDSASARLLGRRWPHLLPEHLVCFSRTGLTRLLVDVGFNVREIGFALKRVNLRILVHHAELHPEVIGRGAVRLLGQVLPASILSAPVPFNIGEFYVIATR